MSGVQTRRQAGKENAGSADNTSTFLTAAPVAKKQTTGARDNKKTKTSQSVSKPSATAREKKTSQYKKKRFSPEMSLQELADQIGCTPGDLLASLTQSRNTANGKSVFRRAVIEPNSTRTRINSRMLDCPYRQEEFLTMPS